MSGRFASDDGDDLDRGASSELPSLGVGRHFSWAILEHIDEPEVPDRGVPTRKPLALNPPLLDAEQEQALGRTIQAGTDPDSGVRTPEASQALQHLVLANMRLCIRPARSAPPGAQQFDDIVQHALMGLFRAAEKFDPEHGNRFSTYAMYWIRQAIDRGHARDGRLIRIPVHVLNVQKKLSAAIWRGVIDERSALEVAAEAIGIEVSAVEAARAAEVTVYAFEELADHLAVQAAQDPRFGERETDEADEELDEWAAVSEAESSDVPGEALMALVGDLLSDLPVREKEVLVNYYGLDAEEEMTLEELGECFGLTRERIRQVRNDALHSLRVGIAVGRRHYAGFDDDFGLEPSWLASLEESGATQPFGHPDDPVAARRSKRRSRSKADPAKERPSKARAAQVPDATTVRRQLVSSTLSDLSQATSRLGWWSELSLPPATDAENAARDAAQSVLCEPFSRSDLIEALTALDESVDSEVIARAHSRIVLEAIDGAVRHGWPAVEGLSRLLRTARLLGVSEDDVVTEIAIRTLPTAQMTLEPGLNVTSTWHYDADDADHERLRAQLHEHGARLGLVWKDYFDDEVSLVIAERSDHRSKKTVRAHINSVAVCDIPSFLKAEAGSTISVVRTPDRPPKLFTCRRCTRVLILPVGSGPRRPARCDECSEASGSRAASAR